MITLRKSVTFRTPFHQTVMNLFLCLFFLKKIQDLFAIFRSSMQAKRIIVLIVVGVIALISFGKLLSLSLFEVSECETFRTEKESTFVRCEMKLCFLNIASLCYSNVHTYSGFLSKSFSSFIVLCYLLHR